MTAVLAWMAEGACLAHDADTWFPDGPGNYDAALTVCAGCPVRADCARHALDRDERWGVWGGLTEDDRDAIRSGRTTIEAVWARHEARRARKARTCSEPDCPRSVSSRGLCRSHYDRQRYECDPGFRERQNARARQRYAERKAQS